MSADIDRRIRNADWRGTGGHDRPGGQPTERAAAPATPTAAATPAASGASHGAVSTRRRCWRRDGKGVEIARSETRETTAPGVVYLSPAPPTHRGSREEPRTCTSDTKGTSQ